MKESFEYVFKGLLKEIRPVIVSYGHEWNQFEQVQDSYDSKISIKRSKKPYWEKAYSSNYYAINSQLEKAKKNIQENINELEHILPYFIQQWETILMNFKKFIDEEYTIQDLVDKEMIKFNWLKKTYPIPFHNVIDYGSEYDPYTKHGIDKSKIPDIPEEDREFTEEELTKEGRLYLKDLVKPLDEFISFLKHKYNVSKKEKGNDPKIANKSSSSIFTVEETREIKRIISKNNIEDAFDRLMEVFEGHPKENDLIQLIRRYNKNKRNLHNDLLSNADLQNEGNKIVDALLFLIK